MNNYYPGRGDLENRNEPDMEKVFAIMAKTSELSLGISLTEEDFFEIDDRFISNPSLLSVHNRVRGKEVTVTREQWVKLRQYAEDLEHWQNSSPSDMSPEKMADYDKWLKSQPSDDLPDDSPLWDDWYNQRHSLGLDEIDHYLGNRPIPPSYGNFASDQPSVSLNHEEVPEIDPEVKPKTENGTTTSLVENIKPVTETINPPISTLDLDQMMAGPNQMVLEEDEEEEEKINQEDVPASSQSEAISKDNIPSVPEEDIVPPPIPPQTKPDLSNESKTPPVGVSQEALARRRIGIIETDLVTKQARDLAEEKLTADKKELSGVSGFLKKIWKYNWGYEYLRQKEIARVKKEIEASGSIYGQSDLGGVKSTQTKEAILERFLQESPDLDLVHHLAEEEINNRQEDSKIRRAKISFKNIIKAYATGRIEDEESFIEERNRVIARDLGLDIEDSQSLAISNELFEIAKNARDALGHGIGLANLDLDFDLIIGHAKSGARTEAQLNSVDRIIDKLKANRLGVLANETAIALGYSLTVGLTQRFARSGAAAWLTFGGSALVGGAFIGITENSRLKQEMAQMERESALGKGEASLEAKRRREMEGFLLEKTNANDLTDQLIAAFYQEKEDGTRESKDLSVKEFNEAHQILAGIESKIRVSDSMKVDLLKYSSPESIERERTALDIERAKAKVRLRKIFESDPKKFDLGGGRSPEGYLNELVGVAQNQLTRDNSQLKEKQRLFDKFRRGRVAGAVVKGVAIGLIVGTIVQDVDSFREADQEGLIEKGFNRLAGKIDHFAHSTTLNYLFGGGTSSTIGLEHHLDSLGPGQHLRLPDGLDIRADSAGHHDLFDVRSGEDKLLVNDITFNQDNGSFSPETLAQLKKAGIVNSNQIFHVESSVVSEVVKETSGSEVPISADEYLKEYGQVVSHLHRTWTVDDLSPNHLGIGDPTLDGQGNVVIKLNLTGEGSVLPDGTHLDPLRAAADGKFRIFITDNINDQAHPVELVADPNGQVIISPDSPYYKMFKVDEAGKVVSSSPRFIEVGIVTDESSSGTNAIILATQEGQGNNLVGLTKTLDGTKTVEQLTSSLDKEVFIADLDLLDKSELDLPFIVPVTSRTPLERLDNRISESGENNTIKTETQGIKTQGIEAREIGIEEIKQFVMNNPSYRQKPKLNFEDAPSQKEDYQFSRGKGVLGYKLGQMVSIIVGENKIESGWKIENYRKATKDRPAFFFVTKKVNGLFVNCWVTLDELNFIHKPVSGKQKEA